MTQLARRLQAAAAHQFPWFSYAGQARDNTAGSGPIFTFTGMPIGADLPRRTVVVLVGSITPVATARTVTSVKLNSSANRLRQTQNAENAMAIAATSSPPSGTTADIEVTFSGLTDYGCMIAVYALYNLRSELPEAVADVTYQASSAETISTPIAVSRGGILLAAASTRADRSATWSGGISEDMDQSGQRKMTAASRQPGAAATVTPLVTWFDLTNPATQASMIAGAWR